MANTKKRVLSLLLAAVMMLTMMPTNAIALSWDDITGGIGDIINGAEEIAELVGQGKLVCEDENHCTHGEDCYVTEQVMQTEHNEDCNHKHSTGCMNPDSFNCSYEKKWYGKKYTCGHGLNHCGMTGETLICNNQHGMIDVTTLVCTKAEHGEDCYVNLDDIKAAFDHIESAEEVAASAYEFGKCWLAGGKCGITYKLGEVELNLCEEHFCSICKRLPKYCDCVEITFANIGNIADNTKTVKVKAGETIDVSKIPNAELINYHFLGWFDAEGNEFDPETIYTEDVTFTAQYKALTEAEKLQNTVNFIKNNFNLGAELGRMITILSKGEITKETIVTNKDQVISAIDMYLLTNQLTGKISAELAKEITELMKESDEYTTLFAEWLWPENAVLMPEVDEILSGIDFDKLAEEIKDAIAEEYGIEFTQEWIDENRALAEQYIAEALKKAEAVSEAQKQILLEQLEAKKAEAMLIMAMIRCEMVRNIKAEIADVKAFVKELLADTALGIQTGKNITRLSGLNNQSAMKHGAEFKTALIAALALTDLTKGQQEALAALIDENDGIVVQFIDWLWPTITVCWMNGDVLLEKDVIAFDAAHEYNGATPVKEGNDEFTYLFAGWEKITDDNGNVTCNAVFATEINEYTITFVNEDGTVLSTEAVPYGTTPEYKGETPVKEGNAQYSYTFAGWDKEVTTVTGDAAYTATFDESVNTYTITFVIDGVESTATYAYGEVPTHADPTKAADAEFTYKFAGWDKEFVPVTGDETYTASFVAIPVIYTVTWMVNGEAVEVDYVTYGTMPEFNGETPAIDGGAEFTYTFSGWDKEAAPVTESVIYTALFDSIVNEYTVTWIDEDGTVLLTETYAYGETPVYTGATPFKADTAEFYYDFAGFGEIAAVTSDVTYTAQYTAITRMYRVTFKDGEKTLSSLIYAYGDTIVAPGLPTKKGWNSAWNTEFSTVTGELTVEVVWSYKVFDSHKLHVFVGYGKSATDSTKGWFETTSGTIYGARDYYSYYVDGKYTGSTVMTAGVDYDSYTANPGDIKVNGVTYTNGQGSSNDFYVINEYVMVATSAQYHLDCHATLYHTVTFVDYNGNVIETVYVQHGGDITAPADPTRKGYVFTGWDKEFTNVNESMTITAQYDYEYVASAKLKINVGNGTPASGSTKGNALSHWGKIYNARSVYSYYDYPNYKGDSIMSTDDFDYARTSAEAIPGTVKYQGVTYTNGKGSSDNYYVLLNEGTYVACRGEYHLDYKASFYNVVTFVVDGVEYKVDVLQGTDAECPVTPEKEGYNFIGWDSEFSSVNGSMTVTAQFEIKTYNVSIKLTKNDSVRRIIRLNDVAHGTVIDTQWLINNKQLGLNFYIAEDIVIDADGDYAVEFYGIEYTIIYKDEDGTILQSSKVEYGSMPEFTGATPTKEGDAQYSYTFAGWTPVVSVVSGDETYFATYTQTINQYTVTFVDEKGNVIGTSTVDYGTAAVAPADIEKFGYNFIGWDKDFSNVTENMTVTARYEAKIYRVRIKLDVVDAGSTYTKWMDIAHDTVINNQWLRDHGYLTMNVVEDVVINEGGVIVVNVVAN